MDFLNITENIQNSVRKFNEVHADTTSAAPLIMDVVMYFVVVMSFGTFMWIFDIQATHHATLKYMAWAKPYLGATLMSVLPILSVAITLMPSMTQMALSKYVDDNPIDMWVVVIALAFDILTDWPTSHAFVSAFLIPLLGEMFPHEIARLFTFPLTTVMVVIAAVVSQAVFFSKLPLLWLSVKKLVSVWVEAAKAAKARKSGRAQFERR